MTYSSEVLADSPLVYWRMGDASGTVMADSSGSSRSGTYVGSPTLGATGLLTGDTDTAVSFSGSNYGNIGHAAWMDVAQVTVEAWVKPTNVNINQSVLDRDNQSGWRVSQFRLNASGKLEYLFWSSGGFADCVGTTTLVAGTTYHVAATFDGANAKVYVNGVVDHTTAMTGSLVTPSVGISVGVTGDVTGDFANQRFIGRIDEAAYYGTALSSTRILAHYNAGITAPAAPPIRRATIVASRAAQRASRW